jgi:hypothetical protein
VDIEIAGALGATSRGHNTGDIADSNGDYIYHSAAAFTLPGTLTLVFDSSTLPTAIRASSVPFKWTFKTDAAFSTAAGSKVVFHDGTNTIEEGVAGFEFLKTFVNWEVGAAISLGANSKMVRNLKSTAGAVALGAGATCTGSITADVGPVTLGVDAECGDIFVDGAVSLGASTTTGAIQANGAIVLGATAEVVGAISALDVSVAPIVTVGVGAKAAGLLPTDMIGAFFLPGIYEAAGAITNSGTVTLLVPDCLLTGNTACTETTLWDFVIDGAFSAAASSKVVFIKATDTAVKIESGHTDYPALCAAVIWDVTGAITLGASAIFVGLMDSELADITLGASAEVHGSLTANNGAVTMGASAISTGDITGGTVTKGAGASGNAVVLLPSSEIIARIKLHCNVVTEACTDASDCCALSKVIPGIFTPTARKV